MLAEQEEILKVLTLGIWIFTFFLICSLCAILVMMFVQDYRRKMAELNAEYKANAGIERIGRLEALLTKEQNFHQRVLTHVQETSPLKNWGALIKEAEELDREHEQLYSSVEYPRSCTNLEYVLAMSGLGPIEPLIRAYKKQYVSWTKYQRRDDE